MPLIENLQITNFKCFKQLEIKGLGQVNLIGGKNNVGKTAFLEAVAVLLSSPTGVHLGFALNWLLKMRQEETNFLELDFFYDSDLTIKLAYNLRFCTIKRISKNNTIIEEGIGITEGFSNDEIELMVKHIHMNVVSPFTMSIEDFSNPDFFHLESAKIRNQASGYISSTKTKEQSIAILLGKIIDLGREEFLNQSLELFDNNIVAVKQVTTQKGVVLKLKVKNKQNLVLLSSFGEGINRYIAILCAIWANKDGFLLIDEIENGIHFTNYPKLWEIIFKVSVEANCQLFITTHSKECITAFNDMQFEVENCNAQYFELYRNQKTDLITSFARDKEQLRYALTHEGKVRGE